MTPTATSQLQTALRATLAGRRAEDRTALIDGILFALDFDPAQIAAALDATPVKAPSVRQRRAVMSDAALSDLVEQASTAVPPLPPGPPPVDPPGTTTLAGDPDRAWRKTGRYLDAYRTGGLYAPDGPEVLRGKGAAHLLDDWFAMMEWSQMSIDPAVRALAARGIEAGEAILRGDTDLDGRVIPLGRLMGLQPASGTTAAPAIAKRRRDALIRTARASVPEWRDARPYTAARLLLEGFSKYCATGFAHDCARSEAGREGRAPADQPRASFFRLSKLEAAPGGAFPTDTKTLVHILKG
ncbi:hypothetical protein [Gemmobacter serpentinus]|uniref:hypothetical protein n=1 Tax=Gemmobacter serpentinus TaxID=2652247 RepID=UPI00124E404E|nr:hypothetical protein [Gemmobacter serpentinus]